jgi:hypothetical protein
MSNLRTRADMSVEHHPLTCASADEILSKLTAAFPADVIVTTVHGLHFTRYNIMILCTSGDQIKVDYAKNGTIITIGALADIITVIGSITSNMVQNRLYQYKDKLRLSDDTINNLTAHVIRPFISNGIVTGIPRDILERHVNNVVKMCYDTILAMEYSGYTQVK